MTDEDLQKLVKESVKRYEALTPEARVAHDYEQRRSFARGMCPHDYNYQKWCEIVDQVLPPLREPLTYEERATLRVFCRKLKSRPILDHDWITDYERRVAAALIEKITGES